MKIINFITNLNDFILILSKIVLKILYYLYQLLDLAYIIKNS